MKKKLLLLAVGLLMLGVLVLGVAFATGRGLGRLMRRTMGVSPHGSTSDGPTYFDDARLLAEGFQPVLGGKPELCSLIIRRHEAALTLQSGPEETTEHLLQQPDGHARAHGHGTCTARPVRSLGDAIFPWSDVDLSLVPTMVKDACARLGFSEDMRPDYLLLERPAPLPEGTPPDAGAPSLGSGPPRWKVVLPPTYPSPAFAEFDLAGKFIRGVGTDGGLLEPSGPVSFVEQSERVSKILGEKLGPDFKFEELEIHPAFFNLEGRPAGQTSGLVQYRYRAGELGEPGGAAMGFRHDLEQSFFLLSELDFSLVPKMLRDGRARIGKPNDVAAEIKAEKNGLHSGLHWLVYFSSVFPQPLTYDANGKLLYCGATICTADAGSEGDSSDSDAIHASDLEHVDPLELLGQATAAALKLEPKAQFTHITTNGPLVGGTVDLRGSAIVTYSFEYSYFDRGKPPGKDKVDGDVWVNASNGRFSAMRKDGPAMTLDHLRTSTASSPPLPQCPVKKAWAAAVQSGVPDNAVARLLYEVSVGYGGTPTWRFRVEGHPELDRDVDSVTCKVVGRRNR